MSSDRNFGRVRSAARYYAGALIACAGLSVVSLAGCFAIADGVPPSAQQFYYPTGLVVSPGRTNLYVVNSDFDLQYSGGTVQQLDLVALRKKLRSFRGELAKIGRPKSDAPNAPLTTTNDACASQGLSTNDNKALFPGPCSPFDAVTFVDGSVEIGAFASSAALAVTPNPCETSRGARLFVAVRGDPSVTYFDIPDDRELSCTAQPAKIQPKCSTKTGCLSCGAETNNGRCAGAHLVGTDPATSERELILPVEPYGMDIDDRGEAIVIAHQTDSTASLVVNRWDDVPALEYYTSNLSPGPTDVAALPVPRLVEEQKIEYTPAFVVSYRAASEFTLLRYQNDNSGPQRPFLTRGLSAGLATTANSADSRGVAVDDTDRRACEDACGTIDREVCLRGCAEYHPLGIYMANRNPAALVIGRVETKFTEGPAPGGGVQVTGAYEVPSFYDSVPLAFGSSQVELGYVVDTQGHLARRIFVVAFDSRYVFSYDPDARRVDSIIRTGRGPHAITFDSGNECEVDVATMADCPPDKIQPYATMYVSHFTDSYIGVVDLDSRNRTTFGSIYMTLGKPVPPKGSQ